MYRGRDTDGNVQGGPMYFIVEGLGKRWKPLAVFFSLAGLLGCTPMFQSNQLTQIIRDTLLAENGLLGYNTILFAGSALTETGLRLSDVWIGLILVILFSLVIFGGSGRICQVGSMWFWLLILLYIRAVSDIFVCYYLCLLLAVLL